MSDSAPLVAGVIGWPVAHSRSPAIHRAAASETGVALTYGVFPVRPGNAVAALDAMRTLGIRGLSVTMPHKQSVIAGLDSLSDAARRLDAVNCVINAEGRLHGENTDGSGFLRGLRETVGHGVDERRVVVLGAGGAARAIVDACASDGAADVCVVNRSEDRARVAAALAGEAGRVGTEEDLGIADIVVNATPLGMAGTPTADLVPCSLDSLNDSAVVVDIITNPPTTSFMDRAAQQGHSTVGGLPMLVGQAIVQFELWTGVTPPFAPLRDAAAEQN